MPRLFFPSRVLRTPQNKSMPIFKTNKATTAAAAGLVRPRQQETLNTVRIQSQTDYRKRSACGFLGLLGWPLFDNMGVLGQVMAQLFLGISSSQTSGLWMELT